MSALPDFGGQGGVTILLPPPVGTGGWESPGVLTARPINMVRAYIFTAHILGVSGWYLHNFFFNYIFH